LFYTIHQTETYFESLHAAFFGAKAIQKPENQELKNRYKFFLCYNCIKKQAVIKQEILTYKIAVALGLKIEDLDVNAFVPTIVKTEVSHTMGPIKNSQILNSIVPDHELLIQISKEYKSEGFYCFTISNQNTNNIAEARFFNPVIGIYEDPATGTAAGPLIGFLTPRNLLNLTLNTRFCKALN